MIYFQNNGNEREKYEIEFDYKQLDELAKKVAKKCGELSIVHDERKLCYVPRSDSYSMDTKSDTYHYITDVKTKKSGNKAKEWDHYDEYEVDLYFCDYNDYICPELVNFIKKITYEDKDAIRKLFTKDFKSISKFPTVKEKIEQLKEEISAHQQEYTSRKNERVEALNRRYNEMTEKPLNIEKQIRQLKEWASQTEKELAEMDKKYTTEKEELNNRLSHLISIEALNENQEDVSKYVIELLSLIEIRLIDKISLDEKRISI